MKAVSKICSILSTILLIVFAGVAAVLILPVLLGCKSMAVISGSMEPEIPVGSIVIVKEVEPEELEPGDVISYTLTGSTMVTHRILAIDEEKQTVTTKGDANEAEDGNPVSYDRIVGREIFHVPYLGYLSMYIKTPLGIAGGCVVLMILIILNFLPSALEPEEKKRQEKKRQENKTED